jgi:hypothetical protein
MGIASGALIRAQNGRGEELGRVHWCVARCGTFTEFMTSVRGGVAANIQQWLPRRVPLLKLWSLLLVLSFVIKMNLVRYWGAPIGEQRGTAVSWRRTLVLGAAASIRLWWLARRFSLLEPLTLLLVLLHLSKREVAKFGVTSISAWQGTACS